MTGYPLHLKIINDKKWIPLTHKYDVITEWRKRLKRHESKYITTHKAKKHHPVKNAFKVALPCVIALFWLLTSLVWMCSALLIMKGWDASSKWFTLKKAVSEGSAFPVQYFLSFFFLNGLLYRIKVFRYNFSKHRTQAFSIT